MSYTPQWANGTSGRVVGGEHYVKLSDAEEIADAVNRRRRLIYAAEHDFSSHVYSGAMIYHQTFDQLSSPFQDFRGAFAGTILSPEPGGLGGEPVSPTSMEWITTGGDVLIFSDEPGEGYASFFAELNDGTNWTDPSLSGLYIRDVHMNELREAAELLSRGRWSMPVYWAAGIFSMLPDNPWLGGLLANNGTHEVRSLGFAYMRSPSDSTLGLTNVTALASSKMIVYASRPCSVALYRIPYAVDFESGPTWNNPGGGTEPGGLEGATLCGTAAVSDDGTGQYVGEITGAGLAAGLQDIIDGGQQNFLMRRTDTSDPVTASFTSQLIVEFTLNTPPN